MRLGSALLANEIHASGSDAGRLDIVPMQILQRYPAARGLRGAARHAAPAAATVAIHLGFAAIFAVLLTWRKDAPIRDVEIPVEIVANVPETPGSTPSKPEPSPPKPILPTAIASLPDPRSAEPQPQPEQPQAAQPQAPSPNAAAPEPQATSPETKPSDADPPQAKSPEAKAPESQPQDTKPPEPHSPEPPKQEPAAAQPGLVAPPPDAAPAATQATEMKPANLVSDEHQVDAATHEARPAETPDVLGTSDPNAAFAVAPKAEAKPDPTPNLAPAVPTKVPSETDKLAAALPMDVSAMPLSFRSVLSGSGTAISAVYKGVVFGRLHLNSEIGEKARRQHLKGQVMVSFSIDDRGRLKDLAVLQSSGNSTLDALGLDMIRAAAPFPPPPPDAQRAFTPALSFGE